MFFRAGVCVSEGFCVVVWSVFLSLSVCCEGRMWSSGVCGVTGVGVLA